MRDIEKKFMWVYIFMLLLFLGNFNKTLAVQYEKGYIVFLNFQNLSQTLIEKIKEFFLLKDENTYKEKYYNLLKQLAQIKIAEQEKNFLKSLELIKERYPNAVQAKQISSQFGIIYAYTEKNVKPNALVLDENWLLVGVVRKIIKPGYIEILSLNYPNLQFSVSNLDNVDIGLAKTSGVGYIEVNFVDSKTKVKTGDLLMTGGDDIFPKGFLVGEIYKIENLGNFLKLYVSPLADFNSTNLIIAQ